MVNNPLAAKKTLVSLDAVTSAANMRSSRRGALTHCLGLCVLISPCGHYRRLLLALHRCDSHSSTFLPPVPRRCFAISASRGFVFPLRYHEGSDSCTAHLPCRSPRLLRHTFLSFHLQPRGLPSHRLPPRQRDQRVSGFALWGRRLAAALRRIEFVILRTDNSPPVALHPASRRRSYLRLRSCGFLRHGLSPC